MKKFNILLLVLVLLQISGCARKTLLSSSNKYHLTSLAISEKVKMPKELFFMSTGDALSIGLGGALGMLLADKSLTKEKKLDKYLKYNNIDFSKIIKDEYRVALRKKPFYYNKLVSDRPQQFFKITVNMYGLVYHHNIFNSNYMPTSNITIDLIDKNGKVLWSKTDYITSYSKKTIQMPLNKYFENPDSMRKALHLMARAISVNIVNSLP